MVRNRKKKALYEVMGRLSPKLSYGKAVEQLHPKADKDKSAVATATPHTPEKASIWLKRPRIVQFNAGRIEISIPYQLAIALLLGIILAVLVSFRLGQGTKNQDSLGSAGVISGEKNGERAAKAANLSAVQKKPPNAAVRPAEKAAPDTGIAAVAPTGDNVIVLVEYGVRADLVPVQKHFATYGIETEIVKENRRYFLITKNRYENPAKPGTDGYRVKQRIIEAGAAYKGKAPEGYETFAPHFFKDAYGKKVR